MHVNGPDKERRCGVSEHEGEEGEASAELYRL